MDPSVFWNCPGYFCYSIYLMSGHICYIPFSLELDSRCKVVIEVHRKWAQFYAAYHQLLLAQQTAQE